MGNNNRKRSASVANVDSNSSAKVKANKKPASSKAAKKTGSQKQPNPTTAWDAVTTKYPTEINKFFPSQASIPDSLGIVQHLATLPAVDGALEDRVRRVGTNPFTLELGSKGSIQDHHKYEHFHARNQNSRAQGNFKAVLAQASGTPAPVPCSRCSQNRTLWETCMKAPNMPGLGKEDALGGACPGCYYNGTGNTCSNRPPTVKKTKAQPAMSSVADAESSSEAASGSHTDAEPSTAASSNLNQQTVPKPDEPLTQSNSIQEKADDLDVKKMQQLLEANRWLVVDNSMLRKHNERLQARIEELEDMIEAEEQQCMI